MKRFSIFLLLIVCSSSPAWSIEFREERVPVSLSDERTIEAQLRIPLVPKGKRVPAVLLFGGFQNAGRVLDLVKPDRPVLLASFDYPFSPPRKFVFPDSLRFAPAAKKMVHDTIEGIQVLTEMLAGHPLVNPSQLTIIGASLGAPFALAASAGNSDVKGLVLVHGFGAVPQTIAHQFVRAWRPKWGWVARPFAGLLGFASWWYLDIASPEKTARELDSRQHVLVISAAQDSFVPEQASSSLWSAIAESSAVSKRIVVPGDHLQPGSDELISELMQMVWVWASEASLLEE
ncbi:MAG: hypothetical protein A2X94_15190 [Bdellovibrionales bacterium GWB1_55_8]|nr:MAG: hypothetical protein A2X94_15190 [Bdellovibrionales bacterium GWB1_55_8]